jgi:hypothetical protein
MCTKECDLRLDYTAVHRAYRAKIQAWQFCVLAFRQLKPATNKSQYGIKHSRNSSLFADWLLFYSREKAHHVSRAYSNLPSR